MPKQTNGQPLPGSASNPQTRLKIAYGIVYFIAGLNLAFGLASFLFNIELLRHLGIGLGSTLFGLVFLALGFFVQRGSRVALILAIAIFALDGLLGIYLSISQGNDPGGAGIVARIFLLIPMIQGVGAIQARWKLTLSWMFLTLFPLILFTIVLVIEVSSRKYPEVSWAGFPVNVFEDAFMQSLNCVIPLGGIFMGIISGFLLISTYRKRPTIQRIFERVGIISYGLFLWIGMWVASMLTECYWESIDNDGSPMGGQPCPTTYTRPLDTLTWHSLLWALWLIGAILLWLLLKNRLLLSKKAHTP